MAGFAPAYYHESNNAWLNELVGDIIDPNTAIHCRTYGQDSDDDLVDDPDSKDERALTATPDGSGSRASRIRGRLTPQSPRATSLFSRASKRSGSNVRSSQVEPAQSPRHRASSHLQRSSDAGSSLTQVESSQTPRHRALGPQSPPEMPSLPEKESEVLSLNPFVDQLQFLAHDRKDPVGSQPPYRSEQFSPTTAVPSEPDSALVRDGLPYQVPSRISSAAKQSSMASKHKTRTSLGRTLSEKRASDAYEPALTMIRTESVIESVSGMSMMFAPHPGVRPFEAREALGEAAGPSEEDDDHQYPAPFALFLIVLGLCLSVFIISVDRSIVAVAIPQITATFHAPQDVGWYGSAYFLTASAFQPLYGRVYMSFDTRWSFLAALAVFELGSLLAAVSPNSPVFILGRAVQGFGSAGLLTGAFVVGTHSVRMTMRPVLFALVGILYGVGALAGPLLGGVFTDLLTWRWAFWINLPIGAVTFVGVFFFFKPRKARSSRPAWIKRFLNLDLIGNAVLLGAMVQLFLALQLSETTGTWNNAPVIGLICGFGVTLILFIAWIWYKGEKALLPPRIIRQRTVAASCGTAFFLYGALLMHSYYLPIWFQAIKGDSAIHSGINMIPYMVANSFFALVAGIFVSKNGRFAPPAIIGCAIGTIGCGLISTLDPNTSTATWVGFEILTSAGMGMAIQQGFSAVQTALPLEEVPIGTAAVVASQSLGGAIFVSVGNTLLQDRLLSQNNADLIPGVNIRVVLEQGATMFRGTVPAADLPALIALYNDALRVVFVTAVPLCGIAFLSALCMEWRSVRQMDPKTKFEENAKRVGEDEKA